MQGNLRGKRALAKFLSDISIHTCKVSFKMKCGGMSVGESNMKIWREIN